MSAFQALLPAELLVLIYANLPRITDAVSLALSCKKSYAVFARREDRARVVGCIVENIPSSLPRSYPAKEWLERHFPRDARFWTPTNAQLPAGLADAETVEFLTAVGVPVFQCERIQFESRESLPMPGVGSEGKGEDEDEGGGEDRGRSQNGLRESLASDSDGDEDSHDEVEEDEDDDDDDVVGEEPSLLVGTWYSQSIALCASGKIIHQSADSPDENEIIADNLGRFLVLLGVIRSVVCDLRDCEWQLEQQAEQQAEDAEVLEEVVLEKLFDGLARVDPYVGEAGFWEWICNYVSS
ncbi:hypothetical protein BJX64DRAFT_287884 [Aspergillus heterothallicus]